MRTDYRIDDFQQTYMVIDGFAELFEATRQDFAPIYERIRGEPDVAPGELLPGDRVHHRGTQAYALSKAAKRAS